MEGAHRAALGRHSLSVSNQENLEHCWAWRRTPPECQQMHGVDFRDHGRMCSNCSRRKLHAVSNPSHWPRWHATRGSAASSSVGHEETRPAPPGASSAASPYPWLWSNGSRHHRAAMTSGRFGGTALLCKALTAACLVVALLPARALGASQSSNPEGVDSASLFSRAAAVANVVSVNSSLQMYQALAQAPARDMVVLLSSEPAANEPAEWPKHSALGVWRDAPREVRRVERLGRCREPTDRGCAAPFAPRFYRRRGLVRPCLE